MLSGVARLIANHRSSAPSQAHQKPGSFPPPTLPGIAGTTTLSDSRRHRRPGRRRGRDPHARRVSPVTRATLPACRAHYPGGPRRVRPSVASPPRAAFPEIQAGRRPRLHFRGLLRLHSRYGPSDRSTAQGGLRHEASARLVARTGRSSATRATDNSLGGTFLHWWRAPSGRTELSGLANQRAVLTRMSTGQQRTRDVVAVTGRRLA